MGVTATAQFELEGKTYEITTWPATVALERLSECVALLGEDGVGAVVHALGNPSQFAAVAGGAMAAVARNASQSQGGVAGWAKRMLRGTVRVSQVNGVTVRESCSDEFDALFTGRLGELGLLLLEVAKRNFIAP